MKILRYILFPVVPIYYLVTWLRNKLYDSGILKSSEYNIDTICVGNLSVGGTGKTPMTEYLIRLLKNDFRLATLSRGYKRSTEGFVLADKTASARSIGDEPFQFYKKFDDVIVSVDANRQNGISQLLALNNPPELILLDDAFQHRKVTAKFNILLTPFDNLYVNDSVLPTGNLREPKNGAKRADVIVVTKCPKGTSENRKNEILKSLHPEADQQVFFSRISYSNVIKNSVKEKSLTSLSDRNFTLVTGIANSKPLVEFLKLKKLKFEHLNYSDHHEFTTDELIGLKKKDFILTTEKDYMRLTPNFSVNDSLFYLPIEIKIDRSEAFEILIRSALKQKV